MFAEDLNFFLADFGVPASCNDHVATVLFDRPDADILGERVKTTKYQITFRTADFPDMKHGDPMMVQGKQYAVITGPNAIDDGAFSAAELKAVLAA